MSIRTPAAALVLRPLARTRMAEPSWVLQEHLARLRGSRATFATWSLVAMLAAVGVMELAVLGHVHGGRPVGFLSLGALPNATIAGRGNPGEWWRYVSAALVHTSWLHLLGNTAALTLVGRRAERLYGPTVVLATFVLAAAAGGVVWVTASFLGLAPLADFSVGASGGICGLVGLVLMFGRGRRCGQASPRLVRIARREALVAAGVVVVLSLSMGTVNNWGHAGGLLCGAVFGMRLPPVGRHGGRALTRVERGALLAVLTLAVVALAVAGQHLGQRLLEPVGVG